MRASEIYVPPDVIAVLSDAEISETSLTLSGQLDRTTYVQTSEVLARIGGKWNKKAKAHLFETSQDVRGLIAEMIATGQMPRKNELAYFPTPLPVIEQMFGHLDQEAFAGDFSWLEPSAGEGAIVDELVGQGVGLDRIVAVEFDSLRHAKLIRKGFNALCSDFLDFQPREPFRFVVMNPPFSKGGVATIYIDHILHALGMTQPQGMLISIAPSSLLYRTDAKTTQLREMALSAGFIEEIPDESFRASGTDARTVMLGMPGRPSAQLLVEDSYSKRTLVMPRKKAETTLEMPLAVPPPEATGTLLPTLRLHVNDEKLVPNPFQPRQIFKVEDLEELAASILAEGLLQNPLVRLVDEEKQIAYGERRIRAVRLLVSRGEHDGWIVVKVGDHSDEAMLNIALAENLHHRLNAMEWSAAFCRLEKMGLKQAEIGAKYHMHETTVGNKMRLSNLPHVVQEMLLDETLAEGHGVVLLGLQTKEEQVSWAGRAVQEKWPVKTLGALVQEHIEAEKKRNNPSVFGDALDESSSGQGGGQSSATGKSSTPNKKDAAKTPASKSTAPTPTPDPAPASTPAVKLPLVKAPTPAPAPPAPPTGGFIVSPIPQSEHFWLKQHGLTASVAIVHLRRFHQICEGSPNLGRILEADGIGGALDYLEQLHSPPADPESVDSDTDTDDDDQDDATDVNNEDVFNDQE